MKKRSAHDESDRAAWLATSKAQRSFLVEVLQWFHYRPTGRFWVKEEVLTWELLRSLEVLPQSLFLRPLLEAVAASSSRGGAAVGPLLAAAQIVIYRYPSLKLSGSKRNCKSDIGFGLGDGPTVWLEAKTAPFNEAELRTQLQQQQDALTALAHSTPSVVATLLPGQQTLAGIPNVSWHEIQQVFERGIATLRSVVGSEDIRRGYESLAIELVQRIVSHPNSLTNTHVTQQTAPPDASR